MRRQVVLPVAALMSAAVAMFGARGSLGLFIKPWQEAYGAGRGAASLVTAIGFLVYGLSQPVAGKLLGRWGGRRVVLVGLALGAVGFGMGAFVTELWMVIVTVGVVAAVGAGFASLATLSYLAADLVAGRSGFVYGLLTAGGAGGSVLILPIATVLLGVSLRASMASLAVGMAIALVLVAILVRDRSGEDPSHVGEGGFGVLMRTPGFWLLLVPFAVCGYTSTGLTDTHLIPYATDHHMSDATASAVLATLAAFNVAGVLVAGFFTDRVDRGKLLAGVYAMRAGTLFLLPLLTSPRSLFVFAALFGVADFASVPPTTSLTRSVCVLGGWGFALGLIAAAHQAGSALGAWLGGWLFERTGSYDLSFRSSAFALLFAAWLSYRLRDRRIAARPAIA